MLKQPHPVSLNSIRASLAKSGIHVQRIRTLLDSVDLENSEYLEIEIKSIDGQHQSQLTPQQIMDGCAENFASDVSVENVEYRRARWFVRVMTSASIYDPESADAALDDLTALLNSSASALVGDLDEEILDKSGKVR